MTGGADRQTGESATIPDATRWVDFFLSSVASSSFPERRQVGRLDAVAASGELAADQAAGYSRKRPLVDPLQASAVL